MVVGVLTDTNQFIQIDPPMENIELDDGLTVLNGSNYLIADMDVLTKPLQKKDRLKNDSLKTDTLQNKTVRSIYLESQFYSSFRSTIRIVLNLYKYRDIRKKMISLYKNKQKSYLQKLKLIEKWLKQMTRDIIQFQEYEQEVLDSLLDVYTCMSDCKNKKYCLLQNNPASESGASSSLCQLMLPKTHLVSGKLNEELYYGRMADELLRHRRTHLFMFYPDVYLNATGNTEYKIYENEILLPKSAFASGSDYFNELIPFPTKYSSRNTFEKANPSKKIPDAEWEWMDEYSSSVKK
jgi:hypothetical protein